MGKDIIKSIRFNCNQIKFLKSKAKKEKRNLSDTIRNRALDGYSEKEQKSATKKLMENFSDE